MDKSQQKLVQYLDEAQQMETSLITVLQSQIAVAPRGEFRDGLEKHLTETRVHASRIQERLRALDGGPNPVQAVIGFTETLIGQTLALSKAPLDLLRGSGGEEKVLKDAKDACSAEALEIATYTALERLAGDVGDQRTAELAASIRGEEERMLERLLETIPRLTDAVVGADVKDKPSYDITETGAADTVRSVADDVKETARDAKERVTDTAREARRVPGVAQAEGRVKGAVASAEDLAIRDYDELTAEEIIGRLASLSQIDLAKVKSYEQRHDNRTTVLRRIDTLEHQEPWPGYDEQTVATIEDQLEDADDERLHEVERYEKAHKNRTGVLRLADRRATAA